MNAPIILFCYNRPEHLRKTLTWLSQNKGASKSTLFVYCDGPKPNATDEQLFKIQEARKVAHELAVAPVFKKVVFVERTENYGLGTSIITGVTEVINQYGKAIILEDDLETSPLFLDYMNACLEHYEHRKTVFSISGVSRPHPDRFYPKDYQYDVYVSPYHHPTGWATWADRWCQVDWEARTYKLLKNDVNMRRAFIRGGVDYYEELVLQQGNGLNVWSVRFALAHFENHAVSICPIVSYINHIGWGAEATNAPGAGEAWQFERLADKEEIRFIDVLYEDARIINAWYSFTIPQRRSLWGRFWNWFGRRFKNCDEYYLKGKVYYQ